MNTKTLLLSTTALTLASTGMMVSAPPPAHAADPVKALGYTVDPVSGYVEAYGAFGQKSENSGSSAFTAIGGAGRLNWWLSPSHTLQVDAYGNGLNKDVTSGGTAFGLAAHYGWKMPTGNLAVMGSYGQVGVFRFGTLAIEGQLHGSNWTLYGQAGVTRPVTSLMSSSNSPYAAGQGRYFFNQNFEAIADVTVGSFFNSSYSRFGAGLEFKPMAMPFSLFGRGQVETWSSGTFKTTNSQALFGVKLFVGPQSQTLQMNDVNGATYLDLNPVYGEFSTKSAGF